LSESLAAATDLDLISLLRAIPDIRMRRGIRNPTWYFLFVTVLGILGSCQSLRDLERFAIRHHIALTSAVSSGCSRIVRQAWQSCAPFIDSGTT
jgi:hypothetical protein